VDSFVDGNYDGEITWGEELFSRGFGLQSFNKLFVNPKTCPNTFRACEEQTFDDNNKMDRMPLTHWIYAMLHAARAVDSTGFRLSGSAPGKWV